MTDDEGISESDRNLMETQLNEFCVVAKKLDPFMKKLKDDIAKYLQTKQATMMAYAGSQNILAEYEENNLRYYTENASDQLVLRNMDGNQLLENMRYMVEKQRNPFTDLYHWIKGEMYDLSALNVALKERKNVQDSLRDLDKKIT